MFAGIVRKVWPVLRRLAVLAEAAEWLPEVRRQVQTIHHEVMPNGGGSLRDAVTRLESNVSGLDAAVTQNGARIGTLTNRLDAHIDSPCRRGDQS